MRMLGSCPVCAEAFDADPQAIVAIVATTTKRQIEIRCGRTYELWTMRTVPLKHAHDPAARSSRRSRPRRAPGCRVAHLVLVKCVLDRLSTITIFQSATAGIVFCST